MALFGLSKTKEALFGGISKLFGGKSSVDSETLDALEEALISADVGVETAVRLVGAVEERVARDKYVGEDDLKALIRAELADQFAAWADVKPIEVPAGQPRVVLVVGVNGVGKTTSVASWPKSSVLRAKRWYSVPPIRFVRLRWISSAFGQIAPVQPLSKRE